MAESASMGAEILADLQSSYGLTCHTITPVTGGWMNRKWKVSTGTQDVLVKQFSHERYTRDKLRKIEEALQRQIILHANGVICPRILLCQGRAIRFLDDEITYMVINFCAGHTETPETITGEQLHSLGDACGFMHKAFSQLPFHTVSGFPVDAKQMLQSLWENHHTCVQAFTPGQPAAYQQAVLAQEPILRQLTPAFFANLPHGIGHEDFSPDNILFGGNHVSAILDFDRNAYAYIWHDIGRAILSLALQNGRLSLPRIHAFREGYARHAALPMSAIADALRLTWCIETPWWIQPAFFEQNTPKVMRFKDEMLWLTAHWHELDATLGC